MERKTNNPRIFVDEVVVEAARRYRVNRLTFFTERGEGACPLACSYCEPAGTRLLTGDGRWVGIETLRPGGVLTGFRHERGSRPRMVPSVVLATATRVALVYEIVTDKGSVLATGDHLWFMDHHRWRRTDRLKPGHTMRWVSRPIDPPDEESEDYRLGYIVGAGLGDGTLGHYDYSYGSVHQFRLAAKDAEMLDRYEAYLLALGIPYRRRASHTGSASEGIFVQGKHRVAVVEQALEAWRDTEQFYRGFLAGIFDAEGSYDGQLLRIANKDEGILQRVAHCLQRLQIRFIRQKRNGHVPFITVTATPDVIRFVAATQPAIRRKVERVFQHNLYGQAIVQEVRPVGEMEVYSVQTSSETYISEGFASHNCFLAKKGKNQVMPVQVLHDAIDWLREVAVSSPSIHFFGTEPTKQWDLLVEARRYAPDMPISITTNGYLLNQERIQWLAENNINVPVYSIDGGPEHNVHRVTRSGKPSWNRVAENFKLLMQTRIAEHITARGTWTPDDYDLVSRFKALEALGAKSITFIPVITDPRWDEAKVAQAYAELAGYYEGGRSPCRLIEQLIEKICRGGDDHPDNGCKVGYYSWTVTVDGRLALCHAFEEHREGVIGSIYEGITNLEPFEKISRPVDDFHSIRDPYPKPECRMCHAYRYCMGPGFCAEEIWEATGRPSTPPPGYCAHLRGMVTGLRYWAGLRQRKDPNSVLNQLGKRWEAVVYGEQAGPV